MIQVAITETFSDLRIQLPARWVWDLKVTADSLNLIEGRDYTADLETGEIFRLPSSRVPEESIVLADYETAEGAIRTGYPLVFGPSGALILDPPITSLTLTATEPLAFTRAKAGTPGDYFADLETGELRWHPEGRIRVDDSLVISFAAFGRENPETPNVPDLTGLYATPADFVRTYGMAETIRLTQNGNGEGRDLKTEPDWGKLASHLEHATAAIDSAAGPYLEWNTVGSSEYDSRQWIALSFARYHLDPHQGEDIWKQADLALARLRKDGKGGGGGLPPEIGTGLDSRYISYGVAPQTFTQERLQWF